MARPVREILEEQRRLLDAIFDARGPALRRAYFALIEQLFDRNFRVLAPHVRVTVGMVGPAGRLLEREEARITSALEDLLVTMAMNTGRDSVWSFLKSAGELDPLAQRFFDAFFADVPRLVNAREGGARVFVKRPTAGLLLLLFAALRLEVQRAADNGQTVAQLKQRFADVARDHWWRVARISRVVEAWTFNAVRTDMVREVGGGVFFLRWTELVDDATGQPLDDRVAADSLVLHGQVARPGESFTMPPHLNVRRTEWLRSWNHPPNRPNDRAVLTLWRSGLGVPAWVWRDGARVPLT